LTNIYCKFFERFFPPPKKLNEDFSIYFVMKENEKKRMVIFTPDIYTIGINFFGQNFIEKLNNGINK